MNRVVSRILISTALAAASLAGSIDAQARRVPPAGSGIIAGRAIGTIDGIVSDTGLAPIQAAFVSILGTNLRIGTGPNGRFRITKIPAGEYLLIVKRVGFSPVSGVIEVPANDTLRLAYTLERINETLPTVVITEKSPSSRLTEFEQRRRVGMGEFMTAAEIAERNSVYTTELMRNFKTVNVSPSTTGAITEYFALSHREGGNPQLGACPMQVYLDEIPLPTPFNLDLLPSPRELAGIEVYSGSATIPPQFNGMNRGCGAILVWTKDGGPATPH